MAVQDCDLRCTEYEHQHVNGQQYSTVQMSRNDWKTTTPLFNCLSQNVFMQATFSLSLWEKNSHRWKKASTIAHWGTDMAVLLVHKRCSPQKPFLITSIPSLKSTKKKKKKLNISTLPVCFSDYNACSIYTIQLPVPFNRDILHIDYQHVFPDQRNKKLG